MEKDLTKDLEKTNKFMGIPEAEVAGGKKKKNKK